MYWQVNEGTSHRTDRSILGQLRLSVAHDFGPVAVVVGGALNAYPTNDDMAPLLVARRGMPTSEHGVTVEVWPSAFVGVRL